jgi:acetyl-CoA carboxylase biotin carboxylase subunit
MITGIKTTIPLQLEIMQNKDFLAGKYDTGFLERMLAERGTPKKK